MPDQQRYVIRCFNVLLIPHVSILYEEKFKKKAAFIDRDGVINKMVVINGEITSPKLLSQFEIYDYAQQAIRTLRKDYLVIVVSNQPDIARGRMDDRELEAMNKKMHESIDIDDLFICRHDDSDNCLCRKPKPGMLIEAATTWNINLEDSLIIGDSWRDMLAGKSAGVKSIYINNSLNNNEKIEFYFEAENLADAVEKIYK